MPAIPPIHTPRLILRENTPADLPFFSALFRDPAVRRYEGAPLTEEEARARLEGNLAHIDTEPRNAYCLAITRPPSDELIGEVSLVLNFSEIHEWEIGWTVSPAYWGQGIAPEAARAMLRYAFEHLDANRVVAFCHAGNQASVRVMEKLGMRREGHLRETRWLNGGKYDEFVYAILRADEPAN